MTSNGADEKVQDMAKEVSQELREMGRELHKRAEAVRKEAAKQLNSAAASIRKEVRGREVDTDALQRADEIAKGLEKAAHYLNSRSVDQMGGDATRVVQRYPMRAVIITFIVGALIGLMLRGEKR